MVSNLTWTSLKPTPPAIARSASIGASANAAWRRRSKLHSSGTSRWYRAERYGLAADLLRPTRSPQAARQVPETLRDLPRSRTPIRKELQPLLAEHHVKTAVREGHFECAALLPLDIRNPTCRNNIASLMSNPTTVQSLPRHRLHASCHNTRAASQIENAISVLAPCRRRLGHQSKAPAISDRPDYRLLARRR